MSSPSLELALETRTLRRVRPGAVETREQSVVPRNLSRHLEQNK